MDLAGSCPVSKSCCEVWGLVAEELVVLPCCSTAFADCRTVFELVDLPPQESSSTNEATIKKDFVEYVMWRNSYITFSNLDIFAFNYKTIRHDRVRTFPIAPCHQSGYHQDL